ncbi:MAG: aminoglycoside phosphotransferase [Actinophytocola sp.]|uniref:hypothetical protein n=1 Tax=Actinophytocola sp. TaxID=1872138 RepID=UPI0013243EAF|nr:hypothetical protein [Actinophytocola sp.]MPZ85467.1 aminoglycoside phosphotransferase [Actinophytocola sp.]
MTPTTGSAAHGMTPVAARADWNDLPERVRAAVQEHTGDVHQVSTISRGLNAAFTARLRTDSGMVFTKGVPTDRAAAQRREADINQHVQPIAPRLLWQIDTGGWHVLGFEHLNGRPADLGPESTDLLAVACVLGELAELESPNVACRRVEDRWADAAQNAGADAGLLAGDQLLHTDLNPHNILITDAGVRIVDWSWPTLGAAWIDTACAALWLIAEGHTPADAEAWASGIPIWTNGTADALDAFAAINAGLWGQIAEAEPRPWKLRLHGAATALLEHRRR